MFDIYIYIFFAFRGRYLNTRTHAASVKQAIIRKEWSKCVGCKLHCGIALQDGGMSIEEAAIFLNTSFIVLSGELRGGSVTVFTCSSQDVGVFVCLCQGE